MECKPAELPYLRPIGKVSTELGSIAYMISLIYFKLISMNLSREKLFYFLIESKPERKKTSLSLQPTSFFSVLV